MPLLGFKGARQRHGLTLIQTQECENMKHFIITRLLNGGVNDARIIRSLTRECANIRFHTGSERNTMFATSPAFQLRLNFLFMGPRGRVERTCVPFRNAHSRSHILELEYNYVSVDEI